MTAQLYQQQLTPSVEDINWWLETLTGRWQWPTRPGRRVTGLARFLPRRRVRCVVVWTGGAAWTGKHELWLRQQHFDRSGWQLAFDVECEAVLMAAALRDRLDEAIQKMAGGTEYTPVVRRPCCLRGGCPR